MNKTKLMRVLAILAAAALMIACLAGCSTTESTATTDSETATGGGASMLIILVVMLAVFYFFMIRPENKKKKQLEEMRSSLAVGDDVTTIGGIVGKVVAVKDNYIVFETGEDRVRIQVAKWAISTNTKAATQEQANG